MAPVRLPLAIDDAWLAACPFIVTSITGPSYQQGNGSSKKRKRGNANGRKLTQEWPLVASVDYQMPEMDVSYTVRPRKRWLDMTRYNSFVLNGVKYCKEDFVYIANEATVAQQNTPKDDPNSANTIQLADHWVANILEIRAADEHHVYARVYWMYSPDELPPNAIIKGQLVSEKQTEYCQNELIASNHMDIINVVSVVKRAIVHELVDSENDRDDGAMYWRQAFDCRNSSLCWVDGRVEAKTFNVSETSTVVDANVGRTHVVLATTSSKRKPEKKRSPSEPRMDKLDNVRAKQLDSEINGPVEIPCGTKEDAGISIAKNLGARSNLVESDTISDYTGSAHMSAVAHSGPQVESVSPATVDAISRDTQLPLPGCAHSPRTPSASTGLTSTAMALRVFDAGPLVPPAYLPSKSQHVLLTHLQSILEISCYKFAKRIMPDILQRHGWDCAESVELNRWTAEFQRRQKCFSALEHAGKPLKTLFRSIATIRHCAVHRRKVSMKGIEQLLLDAEALAMLLGDTERVEQISRLRQEMQTSINELKRYSALPTYARPG